MAECGPQLGANAAMNAIAKWIKARERALLNKYNVAPDSPENRARAAVYVRWLDQEILRGIWTNEAEIAPGVWRSNHPTPARFAALKARGIAHVLNLRGASKHAHYLLEEEICAEQGLSLTSVSLSARRAPQKDQVQRLLQKFRTLPRPFLMHCKSGADRAGLASALYMHVIDGQPIEQARKMLSLRFLHIRQSETGVLDLMLDKYQATHKAQGIAFEQWLDSAYDADALQAEFDGKP